MSSIVRGALITRPEPGASETAERVASLGWRPTLSPMLTITLRVIEPLPGVQAVLITSANAIRALSELDRTTRLFTVGDATAARATQFGFTDVTSAGRDAAALSALVIERLTVEGGPLLLASGEGQGMELLLTLRAVGFRVVRRVAYEAQPAKHLPQPAIDALTRGEIGCALFFSAETARASAAALPLAPARLSVIDAVVLSQPVADAICHLPWRSLRVASHPNQESLVALIA